MKQKPTKKLAAILRWPILAIVRFARSLFGHITSIRRVVFDTNTETPFFAVDTSKEYFLVSADDPTIGRHVFVRREAFDFEKFELVEKLLPKSHKRKLLVDIGANIGTICVPAVKRGYFDNAVALEPGPLNFSILMANVHLNNLAGKVSCHQSAAGTGEESKLVFELSDENHGDNRIRTTDQVSAFGEHKRETIEVDVVAVDGLVDGATRDNTLIWIDTQGYEGHALSGAGDLIRKGVPICLEFWPYGLERSSGYELLKNVLLSGKYQTIVDLDNPSDELAFNEQTIDQLYARLGTGGPNTDILVY